MGMEKAPFWRGFSMLAYCKNLMASSAAEAASVV